MNMNQRVNSIVAFTVDLIIWIESIDALPLYSTTSETNTERIDSQITDEDVDDDSAGLSTYADARYSAYDEPRQTPRTASRRPASTVNFDSRENTNDRFRDANEK
jgi:hypothetical protein